jgi:hypothetical protein
MQDNSCFAAGLLFGRGSLSAFFGTDFIDFIGAVKNKNLY